MAKAILGVVKESGLFYCFTSCCRKEKERITEGLFVTVKMKGGNYQTCVDPAVEILQRLNGELSRFPHSNNPGKIRQLDLTFFKLFLWGLVSCDDETRSDLQLESVFRTMESELKDIVVRSCFMEKIKTFKPHVRKSCTVLLNGPFKCNSYENRLGISEYANDTDDFLGFILESLDLLQLKLDLITPLNQQIGYIEGKLNMFRNFLHLISWWETGGERFIKFLLHIRTWANHMACLTCLYWTDEMDESQFCSKATILSDLMQKTMPYTPEVIELYFDVLTARRYHIVEAKEIHKLTQLALRYVDFLLENLDGIEIFREGLTFLLAFAMDPPKEGKWVQTQVDVVMSEAPSIICSIHLHKMRGSVPITDTKYSVFLEKIDRLKAEVRNLHIMIPLSSESSFPRANAIEFLDFLVEYLKRMLEMQVKFVALVKHFVQMIGEELALLRPFLQNIMELQNLPEEIENLQTRFVNLLYNVEYIIKLTSTMDIPLWNTIICFSDAIKNLKLIKTEVEKIENDQICNKKELISEMQSSDAVLPQNMSSKVGGVIIGFKEDVKLIIDYLRGGRKDLTVISISGMPGQGKTTLARRIYTDPIIQYHFHKIVWCHVSKECEMRELLIKILHDISNLDVKLILKLETQDIAERLRKSLKRQKYLIVLDDIWDVDVWHNVHGSFPDDRNGSRIIFTTRNKIIVSQARLNFISHPLQLFSKEESWELMKSKIVFCGGCPPQLLEIGKQIAIYCKGLPLALVLIAGLLGRIELKLDLWNQVAENLKSYLAREGCMDIIELSYKYLPDHLKPCFLYFGAFPRDRNISAKKLKLLWIAEGFIKENKMRRADDLANEYLDNLVSQSLVLVTERSSMGGIKTCNVHDLLYDLSVQKAMEDNFLHWAEVSNVSDKRYSGTQMYNHYRLCLGTSSSFTQQRPICTRKELPTNQVHSLLWSIGYSQGKPYESLHYFLESFKILTVLDLEEVFLECFRFPKVILSFIHLRYLALRGSIERIPCSISDLLNLETLIVRAPTLEAPLPYSMWTMRSLRHVDADSSRLDFEDFKQNGSFAACNVETLCGPILYFDHQTVEFLRRLPRLRKLHCYCKNDFDPMWFSMFGSLTQLEALRIGNKGFLFHNIDRFQKWSIFDFPKNIKKLTLSQLKLPWSAMSKIEKLLPNLEVLKLLYWACEGPTWDLEDGELSKLKFLKLSDLPIKDINISRCDYPFPYLEELVVKSCHSLELPTSFGDICTLKTIRVVSSHKAARSARRIFKEQRNMGNDSLRVFVKTFSDLDIMNINHDCKEGEVAEQEDDDDDDDDDEGEEEAEEVA